MLDGCTTWPEDMVRRYRSKGYWQGVTIPEAIERSIRANSDKTAVIEGERRLSYGELGRRIDRLAANLVRQGLRPLDRVLFQLPNSADLPVVFLALLKAGAIPVLALPAHRQTELSHFINHAGAVAYCIPDKVKDFDYRIMAEEVVGLCPSLRQVFVLGEARPGQVGLAALMEGVGDLAADAALLVERRPSSDEVALMLLSGGTTAMPKLIPRTHDDYVYNFTACAAACAFHRDMVFLAVLHMTHNFTLGSPGLLGVLAVGGTVVVSGATAEEVFPLIARHRVTFICVAVPLVMAWLNSPEPAKHDLRSLECIMNGGAKLVPELRQRIENQFGCTFIESFGTGEGMECKTRPDDPEAIRFLSSGRPVSPDDEIRIVDDWDRDLPDGEPGEVLARGPTTIRGYYNAPEATRRAFTADGFYRMGDVARRVDGYLYLEGRKKDLINRGGEKISCEEVENHILACPVVEGVCVVAMPDPVLGEKACAFVKLKPGERLTFGQMADFMLSRQIAKFKLPERLEIVESFPISPAGKILRRELRDRIASLLATEEAGISCDGQRQR